MAGQADATIIDLSNKNKVMRQHGDKFNVLPMFEVDASDEALFANLDIIILKRARRRDADQSLAGGDGAELRRDAMGGLHEDLFLGGAAGDPGWGAIGVIRAVKGVIIGQLLISIVGFGALFELYSANFLMSHFWAVPVVLFALAFTVSEIFAALERRVSYYAAKR